MNRDEEMEHLIIILPHIDKVAIGTSSQLKWIRGMNMEVKHATNDRDRGDGNNKHFTRKSRTPFQNSIENFAAHQKSPKNHIPLQALWVTVRRILY